MSWLPVRSLVPTSLLLSAACLAGNTHGPSSDDRSSPKRVLSGTDTLAVESDAYLGPDGDDYWKGTTDSLVVDGVRSTRVLIRVNQDEIEEAIGNGTLASATLELTVQSAGASWPTGGATVDAHRVLQHWTEAEVTWVCADGHEGWDMSTGSGSIWQAAHTARTTITNGQTGVVRLNVTADVAAFLSAPQSNHGWLIKRTAEGIGEPGRIAFASRETTPQPRLIIETVSDTTRPAVPLDATPPYDTSLVVSSPDGRLRFFRTLFSVEFDDSTSGPTVRGFLARYNATIVGGERSHPAYQTDAYYLQVPDPGTTYSAYAAIKVAMAAELGVRRVGSISFDTTFKFLARYPDDGQPNGRAGWTAEAASSHTRAWRAVRAPLAWGCENGRYGAVVRLGVIDALFDQTHPDLEGWQVFFDQPRPGEAVDLGELGARHLDDVEERSHGMAVLGVAGATGDNEQGIAGMVWGGNLSLYTVVRGEREWTINWPKRFEQIFLSATERGLRVLVSSVDGGDERNAEQVARIRGHMRRYLEAGAGNILVVPVGQGGQALTVQQFATEDERGADAFRRAAAQLHDSLPGHIIFVHGTDESGARAPGSNVILNPGRQSIAAPSVGITSLARRLDVGLSGIYAYEGGTSLAAPFVAGLAAQLLAMDPTLTAVQVTDYILRGAAGSRLDPATGDSVLAPTIGVPSVYQLDAYGSLSLLSRERAGTPLCGIEVSKRFPLIDRHAVVAKRNWVDTLVAFSFLPSHISVAQGGRRLAVGGSSFRLNSSGGPWVSGGAAPTGFETAYLERDTVWYRTAFTQGSPTRADLVVRINGGPERVLTAGLNAGVEAGGIFTPRPDDFSPTGDFAHVTWQYDPDRNVGGGGTYLVRMDASGSQVLNDYTVAWEPFQVLTGTYECGQVAWRNDGLRLMRAIKAPCENGPDDYQLQQYSVSTSAALVSTSPVLSGLHTTFLQWAPEGGRVSVIEDGDGISCRLAHRRASGSYDMVLPGVPIDPACNRVWVAPLRAALRSTQRSSLQARGMTDRQ